MRTPRINPPTFTAKRKAENLVHIKYKKNTISGIEDIAAGYKAFVELSKGSTVKVLTEIKKTAYFDITESHCLTPNHLWPQKEAIVTESLAARLAMKFLYHHKEFHPIKIFKQKKKAIDWLNED